LIASLRAAVCLPPGKYQLIGYVTTTDSAGITNFISLTLQRYSATRFAVERHLKISSGFQVSEARAPEEIEFICDIRADSPEVWFDASSLRLIRQEK
jgi:hypothetical protein